MVFSLHSLLQFTVKGISAAAGKLGAAIGGLAIQPLFETYGLSVTLIVCGCVSFLGFAVTWFLIEETKGKPLQEEKEPEDSS